MKNVLVFFNSQQVEIAHVPEPLGYVTRTYPNGDEIYLKVMLSGIHSLTGEHAEIFVASDRELTQEEVINAVKKYL